MSSTQFVTNPANIMGTRISADKRDFGDDVAWNDHKIAYALKVATGRDVLDLGCVNHDPQDYRSRYWLHKALVDRSASVMGMDLSESGVTYLRDCGFNVIYGDAQNFNLDCQYDVIVAGDLIEHLENFAGFLESCKRHLRTGGKLVISTPNPWYWRNVVKSVLHVEVPNNIEHTCWLCPRTLRQLTARHGLDVRDIAFGSRYLRDRVMPLPRGIKHTSWHATIVAS